MFLFTTSHFLSKLNSSFASSTCMAPLFKPDMFLFFEFCVHGRLDTSSTRPLAHCGLSCCALTWTHSDMGGGGVLENIPERGTSEFSDTAPSESSRKMSGVQCTSESS